jgi:hypothetical protein
LGYEIQLNAESYISAAAGFVTFLMSPRLRSFSALETFAPIMTGNGLADTHCPLARCDVIGPAQDEPPAFGPELPVAADRFREAIIPTTHQNVEHVVAVI